MATDEWVSCICYSCGAEGLGPYSSGECYNCFRKRTMSVWRRIGFWIRQVCGLIPE